MNMPEPKYKVGDIVTSEKSGWRRIIRAVGSLGVYDDGVIGYRYSNEEVDKEYKPTGRFYENVAPWAIKESSLETWRRGR